MGCSGSSESNYTQFECDEKLGNGSFGQVYSFNSKVGHENCAVKLIHRERAAQHEVEMWRQVSDHEHVVGLLHVFQRHGIYHLVMEKCLDSLRHRLCTQASSDEVDLRPVFEGMLEGVDFLHSRGVVHRDLKPDNFLLSGENGWTAKICDFGSAVLLPPRGCKLHACCGTPLFMPPEMLSGEGYGCGADMWSLGVTVYWTLYGDFPYMVHGVAPDDDANCRAILAGEPKPSFLAACDGEEDVRYESSQESTDGKKKTSESNLETRSFVVDRKVHGIGLKYFRLPPGMVEVKEVLPCTWADTQDIAAHDLLEVVNGLNVRRLTSVQFNTLMSKRPLRITTSRGASAKNGEGFGRPPPTKAVEKFARALLDRSPNARCNATQALQFPCITLQEAIPCAPIFHDNKQETQSTKDWSVEDSHNSTNNSTLAGTEPVPVDPALRIPFSINRHQQDASCVKAAGDGMGLSVAKSATLRPPTIVSLDPDASCVKAAGDGMGTCQENVALLKVQDACAQKPRLSRQNFSYMKPNWTVI